MSLRFLICFLAIVLVTSCADKACLDIEKVNTEIEQIAKETIPDKRTGVRDIQLELSNCNQLHGVIRSDHSSVINEIKNYLHENYSIDSIEFVYLPSKKLGEDTFGVINLSVANIRTNPKHSAELTTQSLLGMPVKILDKIGEWYRIETPDPYIAWVDQGGITVMNAQEFNTWENRTKIFVRAKNSQVLDADQNIVIDLVLGDILALDQDLQGQTLSVILPDGREGFVNGSDVVLLENFKDEIDIDVQLLMGKATELMGRPYLWGGTSVNGMDCSGFMKTLFIDQGYIIPRDASQQVHVGEVVAYDDSLSNVRAGDLIFFGTNREDGSERITHVALYLGEGQIIHSSGSVKIENLLPGRNGFNKDRYETIKQIRRLVGQENKLTHISSIYEK